MNEVDSDSDSETPPKKRRLLRWRFSIRTALVLMTLFAVVMMYFQRRARAIWAVHDMQVMGVGVIFHADTFPLLNKYTDDSFLDVSHLYFEKQLMTSGDDSTFSEGALKNLKDLPNLETLTFLKLEIGKEGCDHIAKCRDLRELIVTDCGPVDDSCVDSLTRIRQLETLNVQGTNLTAAGLTKLANIESLRNLTFSCTSRNERGGSVVPCWYSADEIKSIGSHRELQLTLTREAYLDGADDETLALLAQFDTSSLREVHVRNGDLSLAGIRAVCKLGKQGSGCRRIQFENCSLQIEDLKEIDISKTTLVLEGTTADLNDIIKQFGSQFVSATFGSSGTEFITANSHVSVKTDAPVDKLEPNCFEYMPNLTAVDCFCSSNQSFLKAIEQSQPSIKLFIDLRRADGRETFWDTIKATPSLTSLSVSRPPEKTCPQFTPEHKLESLSLYELPDAGAAFNKQLFQQIARLEGLNELTVRHKGTLGEEISPLKKLKRLWFVNLRSPNDVGANLLLDMGISKLEIGGDHLSPKMIKRVRQARKWKPTILRFEE